MKARSLIDTLFYPVVAATLFFILLGFFTRFHELGKTPSGITWDEAAQGYVGAMVIQTGRDEHNRLLPRVFESFGDYKAPLALYITGISTTIFGYSPWAIRLPYALASVMLLPIVGRVVFLTLKKTWVSLASMWLALSLPWLFHFGRIAFESGLCLLFLSIAIWSWLELREKKIGKTWHWYFLFTLSIVSSFYVYHSAKILTPGILFIIAGHEWFANREWLQKNKKNILITFLAITVLLLPFFQTLVSGQGLARASQTSLLNHTENGIILDLIRNYAKHLNLQFLIGGETDSLRHGTGKFGVFLISHFMLFCLGIAIIIGRKIEQIGEFSKKKAWQKAAEWFTSQWSQKQPQAVSPFFWIALFLLGLLPAAVGFEVPHANRALFAALPAIVIMSLAIAELRRDVTEKLFSLIIGSLLLLQVLEFSSFYRHYFKEYRAASSADWMEQYSEATQLAWQAAESGEKVKFTSQYGQPEIFFAVANDIEFSQYRWQRVPQVTFGEINSYDLDSYSYVVAGSKEKISNREPTQVLLRADGQEAFYVYQN